MEPDEHGQLWLQAWVRKKYSVVTSVRVIGDEVVYCVSARTQQNTPISKGAWANVRAAFFAADLPREEIVDSPYDKHPLAPVFCGLGYHFVARPAEAPEEGFAVRADF